MLDKKGRLFGKISIIDLFVVLVIIMAVVGVGYNYLYSSDNKVAPGVDSLIYNNAEADNVEVLLYVEPVRQMTVNAISVGDKIYDSTTKTYIGEISSIAIENAFDYITKIDGTLVKAEMPEKYRVMLKVKVEAINRNGDYYTKNNIAITRNGTVTFYTEKILTTGTVKSITEIAE